MHEQCPMFYNIYLVKYILCKSSLLFGSERRKCFYSSFSLETMSLCFSENQNY